MVGEVYTLVRNPEPQISNYLLAKWKLNTFISELYENGSFIGERVDVHIENQMIWEYNFKTGHRTRFLLNILRINRAFVFSYIMSYINIQLYNSIII